LSPASVPVDPVLDLEFDKAFAFLRMLIDFEEVEREYPSRENAVYTTSVILWMLVFQRLNPEVSLEAAVKHLIENPPDFIPDNVRVTEGTLSTNTGAYRQARKRMPTEAARWFAERVSRSLIAVTPPSLGTRRAYTIDGTAITLAPEPELRKWFPPASNQHGVGAFPVALLVVAHELASGAALVPEIGAMYGPQAVSETSLIDQVLAQLPPDSVVMADAGFGIFTVAYAAHQAGHKHLLRLTPVRFEALRRVATLESEDEITKTWTLTWRPTAPVRRSHPDLPKNAELNVRLHAIWIHEGLTLYLISDLPDSAEALADLYERRTDVEIDIRNLKVVLGTETIRAQSREMFLKELLTSHVAYNLVIQFRRQAAALATLPPRRLSFKRIWTTFRVFLLSSLIRDPTHDPAHYRQRYRLALHHAQRDKLPHRPNRHYEREAYKKRPKSTHFKTRKPPRDPPDENVK
jgi:hypothetical protein